MAGKKEAKTKTSNYIWTWGHMNEPHLILITDFLHLFSIATEIISPR